MSKTKPQKRLVSKREYLSVVGNKLSLYSMGGFTATLGMICLVLSITCATLIFIDSPHAFIFIFGSVICGTGTFLLFKMSKSAAKDARAIESVTPISDRNALLLPLQETLVRGSDVPLTEQKAELLRAVQEVKQTPQEELLRAGQIRE